MAGTQTNAKQKTPGANPTEIANALRLFAERCDAVEMFMRTTCHGLNNYLTRLMMHAEMSNILLADRSNPKVSERLHLILGEIDAITRLVKGFRIIGRNGANDWPGEVDLFSLVSCVDQFSHDQLKSRMVKSDITGISPSHKVIARETAVGQAIYEIIKNVVDECDIEGQHVQASRLAFASREENDSMVLTLTDSGPAISAAIMDRIWEPFYTTKSTGRHLGIGLTVARELIVSQGGTLQLEIVDGTNQFIITLPMH